MTFKNKTSAVHRLRASALLSGLFNCPRVTLLYVWLSHPEAQEWFDAFWGIYIGFINPVFRYRFIHTSKP